MTKHTWALENLATYLAGGLDAAENARLERHVSGCEACAAALDEARALDDRLEGLFMDERPGPELEDRMVRALRTGPRKRPWLASRRLRVAAMIAAAVLLAAAGNGISAMIENGTLKQPDQAWAAWKEPGKVQPLVDVSGSAHVSILDDTLSMRDGASNEIGYYAPAVALVIRGASRVDTTLEGDHVEGRKRLATTYYNRLINGTTHHGLNMDFVRAGIRHYDVARSESDEKKERIGLGTGTMASYQRPVKSVTFYEVDEKLRKYFKPGDAFAQLGPQKQPPEKKDDKKPGNDIDKDKTKEGQNGDKSGQKKPDDPKAQPKPAPEGRKIIRSGDVDFEVNSFDDAVATVTRLVRAAGGFVATVNSEKLANGKVRGAVVVRVPPEKLDPLVLDLRKEIGKAGELKGQRIGSQDITKQYTDLESRLRAARAMEERLLRIIKDGKGEIKDLIAAEKELGVWRTKIEETEGELRYYANLVSLSTLTVNLAEKEIRAAAAVSESVRVQAGVEVEDVVGAMQDVLQMVAQMKGRVTKSESKQHGPDQYSALLHFSVPQAETNPVRDRLRQIGTVVRQEIDRVQSPENGAVLARDSQPRPGDTQFVVSLYNLTNVAPRETVTLRLASADVAAAYRALHEAVSGKLQGRVVNAQLTEQDRQNVTGQLDFHVKSVNEAAVRSALTATGEVLSQSVARVAKDENVTDKKMLFKVELVPATAIKPRETVTLGVEVTDVETVLAALTGMVKDAKGRVPVSQVTQERDGKVTARAVFEVPLASATGLVEKVKSSGTVRVQHVAHDPQAPEGRLAVARIDVTLSNGELLVPRDDGLWSQVRGGLSFSLRGLAVSAGWLIVGVLFVLPWLLLIWAGVWLVRRLSRGSKSPAASE